MGGSGGITDDSQHSENNPYKMAWESEAGDILINTALCHVVNLQFQKVN